MSSNSNSFSRQVFPGNNDKISIAKETVSPAIFARFVRIHPVSWNGRIAMRVEFHGCYVGKLIRWRSKIMKVDK